METSGEQPQVQHLDKEPPIPKHTPEAIPDNQPETSPSVGAESAGSTINKTSQATQSSPLVLPPVVNEPAAQPPPKDTGASSVSPVIADEVEVIEKEWVDKARRIVADHRDNPYLQERAVEKLQREYLKARYNKDLKPSAGQG